MAPIAEAPTPSVERESRSVNERALALWPRLDRRVLRRCDGDPRRIAAYVERRTSLTREAILTLLVGGYEAAPAIRSLDVDLWFG